jgi:hypothetical protein
VGKIGVSGREHARKKAIPRRGRKLKNNGFCPISSNRHPLDSPMSQIFLNSGSLSTPLVEDIAAVS